MKKALDSDYLNGVYQITLMRTLFDIFIFIAILMISFFVSPQIYKYVVIDFVKIKYQNGSDINSTLFIIDVVLTVLLLSLGLFFTIDGANRFNGTEMVIGIYFTMILFFSICIIRYNKQTNTDWDLTSDNFTIFNISSIIGFIGYLNQINFGKYFVIILLMSIFALFMFAMIKYIILKDNSKLNWLIYLFLIIPIVSLVLAFIVLSIKNRGTATP
jgi:hypothetical protein